MGHGTRHTQFKTVRLDFEGGAHVRQTFVDKVLRVFVSAHPHIQPKNMVMTAEVERLVH